MIPTRRKFGWLAQKLLCLQLLTCIGCALLGETTALVPIPEPASDPQVAALETFLSTLKRVQASGGFRTIPEGPTIEVGGFDGRLALVRQRLSATEGVIDEPLEGYEAVYDPTLLDAVIRFQKRHGLEAKGQIGKLTLRALNRPVDERIRQVEAAVFRRRTSLQNAANQPVGTRLRINIPAFEAELLENGKSVLQMRVVVGSKYKRTPTFSSNITQVTLNPQWTVPQSIVKEELFPKLVRNPQTLIDQGFEVLSNGQPIDPLSVDWKSMSADRVPYTLRQQAGARNPLGRVIFHMPNTHDVYLHDTNARWVFSADYRAASHGCIRLQKPMDLLNYLLADQPGWTKRKVQEVIESGETTRIPVSRRIAVDLVYETVWVDDGGVVQVREDLYSQETVGKS